MSLVAALEKALDEARKAEGLPPAKLANYVTRETLNACISHYGLASPQTLGVSTAGGQPGKELHYIAARWRLLEENGIRRRAHCEILGIGNTGWVELRALMRRYQVRSCVLSLDPYANEVRKFAREFPGYVTPCRFSKTESRTDADTCWYPRQKAIEEVNEMIRQKRIQFPFDTPVPLLNQLSGLAPHSTWMYALMNLLISSDHIK